MPEYFANGFFIVFSEIGDGVAIRDQLVE